MYLSVCLSKWVSLRDSSLFGECFLNSSQILHNYVIWEPAN